MFPCRFTQQPVHYVIMFPGSLEIKAMHHLSETPLFNPNPHTNGWVTHPVDVGASKTIVTNLGLPWGVG